jgi:hypothetical protein
MLTKGMNNEKTLLSIHMATIRHNDDGLYSIQPGSVGVPCLVLRKYDRIESLDNDRNFYTCAVRMLQWQL